MALQPQSRDGAGTLPWIKKREREVCHKTRKGVKGSEVRQDTQAHSIFLPMHARNHNSQLLSNMRRWPAQLRAHRWMITASQTPGLEGIQESFSCSDFSDRASRSSSIAKQLSLGPLMWRGTKRNATAKGFKHSSSIFYVFYTCIFCSSILFNETDSAPFPLKRKKGLKTI